MSDKPTTLAEVLYGYQADDCGRVYRKALADRQAQAVTDFALSPEQIEKSAKALWADVSGKPWEELYEGYKRPYRRKAEAAIRANLGVTA